MVKYLKQTSRNKMTSEFEQFVGKKFTFDDGATMTIIQVKRRDDGNWVTWEAQFPGHQPKRITQTEREFLENYSHLFV